jgi:hypothetical protein
MKPSGLLLRFGLGLAILLIVESSAAQAQVGKEQARDLVVEEEDVQVVQNMFELDESNFTQWVFGNVGGRMGSGKDQLESMLLMNLSEIDRACKLTQDQKNKLLLAGHGDIKHFFDRVAEAKQVFDQLRHDQNNIQAIFQETQPLAASLRAGLFGPDSIFSKTISSTLEPQQADHFRQVQLDKQQFYHRSNVIFTVIRLDQAVGFTDDQRKKMIELVMQETKPSLRSAGQYDATVLIYKISKIPEAKIRPIFDEPRWKALQAKFAQVEGTEQFLKTSGFLDDSDTSESTNVGPVQGVAPILIGP